MHKGHEIAQILEEPEVLWGLLWFAIQKRIRQLEKDGAATVYDWGPFDAIKVVVRNLLHATHQYYRTDILSWFLEERK